MGCESFTVLIIPRAGQPRSLGLANLQPETCNLKKHPMPVDQSVLDTIALSRDEYDLIVRTLGREPNDVELGIFGALWSEHCGYKNSKPLLRLLPAEGAYVLTSRGAENAGAVDIGDGMCVVMKIESHNHPSAVEPYQGAATGVGGIVRDIFAMGARPIALLDSLRFGPLDRPAVEVPLRRRRRRHRRLRQLPRHPHRRRRGRLRGRLRRQPARQRDVRRRRPRRPARHREGRRRRQPADARRRRHRPRRHPRRVRPRLSHRPERALRGAAPRRAGRQPVPREDAARSLPRSRLEPPRLDHRHPGPRRRRPHLLRRRVREPRRHRHRHRRREGAAPRRGHDPLRSHALRVAGADADHRPQRPRSRRREAVRALGGAVRDHRRGHRRPARPHPRRRDGSRHAAGQRARRRAGVHARRRAGPRALRDGADGPRRPARRHRPEASRFCDLLASPNITSKRCVYRQYDQSVLTNTVVQAGADAAVLRIKGTTQGHRRHHRRQRPLLPHRPLPRRRHRRRRGRAQRRLHRRQPRRRHRLPELRQPGAARRLLPDGGRHPRHRRRLRRRSARRSSPATSRSTTRPAAGPSTRRPSSACSASSTT